MTYPEDEAGERNQGTKFKEVADMIFIPLLYHFPSPQGSYASTCLDRTFGFWRKSERIEGCQSVELFSLKTWVLMCLEIW